MPRRVKIFALITFVATLALLKIALLPQVVAAKPAYMDRYDRDPLARADLRGRCTVCHIGRGGGERNDFGEAFEDSGYRITSKLRERFPKLFMKAK
ncbi:MAG: hypothetical protein M3362_23460 [Acidobacteriota bacterium]|nr:hypothetical protein [Acidobacteriota bacterium]